LAGRRVGLHRGARAGMKFLADMGISPRSVAFLRDLGVEAVHLHELGLDRLPDAGIVEKAREW